MKPRSQTIAHIASVGLSLIAKDARSLRHSSAELSGFTCDQLRHIETELLALASLCVRTQEMINTIISTKTN